MNDVRLAGAFLVIIRTAIAVSKKAPICVVYRVKEIGPRVVEIKVGDLVVPGKTAVANVKGEHTVLCREDEVIFVVNENST
jgi:hypothetical protein